MINQEKIQEWVREYLKHIQEISIEGHVNKEEGYKFNSIDNFQKHFNLEDPDLVGMLDKALLNNNLVVGAQYWPKKMLLLYAQDYPKETRLALQNLFDETKEIYTRITETGKAFDNINEIRNAKLKTSANTYIGLRFLSLLLGFRFPDKYNALKPAEWKFFTRFIDPKFLIPIHTSAGEQYRFYEPYIEALRAYLKDREDIKAIREALTRGLSFDDLELRWITQDVIYVTAHLLSSERSNQEEEKETKNIEENDEDVSITGELDSVEDNTGFVPLEKHLEDYIMKNWDIVDFGEKLTLYREDDGTPGQQYVTDVGIIDILAKDTKGNFVIIELKRAETKYHVIGQILNYITWVEENLALKNEKVRGIIVVGKADKTLKSALKQVGDKVALKEYRIKMTFIDPQ
ncbi:MAG: hypothetical protein UU58_C0001G0008 [Candidatus Nomurabacteria bacterium GW2011_GWA2_41_25]|uniref:Endonuclease NucS C-terminal domain-containing protein n=1 Tax=Candidatus Nomurabacteria bacterium GW2011_GWA2_41_25 TaxID=1618736 RepID=A0A0G0YXF7_9BACT|nr:MAG: hypothetical protein UU58_C0001G0008 [Candidatus Nomurabacteria bacterium GW2011_GWA2_41_25]OGI66943.1 MAG: hypothetical protein A2823_02475 [Candidatus Nomurabacteria bacterium RIFCSPHIGHO2_01_FULL_41_91]OGI94047.1 MAG: hypothetical protein A3A07_01900 [Candidatus Nomurabacteria bacterium RIFCSPLOWO2_01_FULL_41_52]